MSVWDGMDVWGGVGICGRGCMYKDQSVFKLLPVVCLPKNMQRLNLFFTPSKWEKVVVRYTTFMMDRFHSSMPARLLYGSKKSKGT